MIDIKSLISMSVGQIKAGTQSVENAGQSMSEVISSARQINVLLSEISTAAREQASGVEQVGHAIHVLDKNTPVSYTHLKLPTILRV